MCKNKRNTKIKGIKVLQKEHNWVETENEVIEQAKVVLYIGLKQVY